MTHLFICKCIPRTGKGGQSPELSVIPEFTDKYSCMYLLLKCYANKAYCAMWHSIKPEDQCIMALRLFNAVFIFLLNKKKKKKKIGHFKGWRVYVLGVYVLGGKCPGGKCPGGK